MLHGGAVWEVEPSAEENEEVERPVVKAKPWPPPKAVPAPKASSSRSLGALPKVGSVPTGRRFLPTCTFSHGLTHDFVVPHF